ncbi:MAG: four helix bundle protein [Planctomycetota bacterium]|jgi:four helix bundle protein
MGFNFEKLDVYEKSIDFVNQFYLATKNYPKEEMFGLTNQFRRAVVSISLNIPEGSAKTKKDFNRFVDMARGSVFECIAILQISERLSYIGQLRFDELRGRLVEISKMLSGLKRSLAPATPDQKQ